MGDWPFRGDLPVDRARQVAEQYRAALERVDPEACAAIDQAARWVGEEWIAPGVAAELEDDWIEAPRAARITGRSTRWVYLWCAANPNLVLRGPTRVRISDLRAHLAERQRRLDAC